MSRCLAGAPAAGAPQPQVPRESAANHREDSLPDALHDKQINLKQQAIGGLASGRTKTETRNGSQVARVGNKWVELKKKADKTDPIFSILAEFGDATLPTHGGDAGPLHNAIAQPGPDNNSTHWKPDFNQAHFNQMVNGPGESMADFYYKQSGGKYSVSGHVTDWVKLQYNGTRYGKNATKEYDFETEGYWNFVNDSIDAWYNAQVAAGKTVAQIDEQLSAFDVWDRFDLNGNGDFYEPDGYLDHFQAIHAGEGEEAGAGDDAIWSHRWAAFLDGSGPDGIGPVGFRPAGGARIGQSKYWVRDYTTEPENGGLGVFAHEYGHDLALPDFYDTAGGDNSSGYWTLMSGGSWMSGAGAQNIGTSPSYLGPQEKLQLGWLDYVTVKDGKKANVALGSAATPEGPLPQAVLVELPQQQLSDQFNTPKSGSYEWWGGYSDDLNNSLVRDLDLRGATSAKVKASLWYNIEPGCACDFLRVQASVDGNNWSDVTPARNGDSDGWQDEEFDLSAYAGKEIKFRFNYSTDGGLHLKGAYLDDISLVTDATAGGWSDDVEVDNGKWTATGFTRNNGFYTRTADHFYLAEFRTFTGYDKNLKTGPYNYGGWVGTPDKVEKFPYQDGMLVWYVNYAYKTNNTSAHPGHGRALPVDARPAPFYHTASGCDVDESNPDGQCRLGNRRQPFDATFGKQPTDKVTFHRLGVPLVVCPKPGIPVFDDSDPNRYWDAKNPWNSVKVAGEGVKIQVLFEMTGLVPVMIVKVTN